VTVFVDSSALIALVAGDDARHAAAIEALANFGPQAGLCTSEYVVVETISLVQRRAGMAAVRTIVNDVLPVIDLRWVSAELHLRAREAMLSADVRGISLVDWTSFLMMRDEGIDRAFTFDHDFGNQGFDVVPR
jgi:uncharacterized protein